MILHRRNRTTESMLFKPTFLSHQRQVYSKTDGEGPSEWKYAKQFGYEWASFEYDHSGCDQKNKSIKSHRIRWILRHCLKSISPYIGRDYYAAKLKKREESDRGNLIIHAQKPGLRSDPAPHLLFPTSHLVCDSSCRVIQCMPDLSCASRNCRWGIADPRGGGGWCLGSAHGKRKTSQAHNHGGSSTNNPLCHLQPVGVLFFKHLVFAGKSRGWVVFLKSND